MADWEAFGLKVYMTPLGYEPPRATFDPRLGNDFSLLDLDTEGFTQLLKYGGVEDIPSGIRAHFAYDDKVPQDDIRRMGDFQFLELDNLPLGTLATMRLYHHPGKKAQFDTTLLHEAKHLIDAILGTLKEAPLTEEVIRNRKIKLMRKFIGMSALIAAGVALGVNIVGAGDLTTTALGAVLINRITCYNVLGRIKYWEYRTRPHEIRAFDFERDKEVLRKFGSLVTHVKR